MHINGKPSWTWMDYNSYMAVGDGGGAFLGLDGVFEQQSALSLGCSVFSLTERTL
jgi:hypothetical protein